MYNYTEKEVTLDVSSFLATLQHTEWKRHIAASHGMTQRLGMWLRKTKVHIEDLLSSTKLAILKLVCGVVLCSLAYFFLPVPQIHQYIGVMFLLFCLPPAANIVALETHYQGTGVSAKYIASGTIVSCVVCVLYGALIHFL